MTVKTVSPHELADLRKQGGPLDLIDVRTPVEFREVHVDFARNVPLGNLDPKSVMLARNSFAAAPLYVLCRSGARGQKACEQFLHAGFANVVNVEGGTLACIDAGLPVVRGKQSISLERQVRIGIGLLVVLSALLSWLVHPGFIALTAFFGAGLVFSGISGICGLAVILGRMPWNQCASEGPSHAAQ